MPETTANGYSNGNHIHNGYEMEDNASFLFTSESVGEGHPGKQAIPCDFSTFLRLFMAIDRKAEKEEDSVPLKNLKVRRSKEFW